MPTRAVFGFPDDRYPVFRTTDRRLVNSFRGGSWAGC